LNNNELGILLSAIIDKVDSERKINKVVKQIKTEAVKLKLEIDDKMAKSIAKDFIKRLENNIKKQEKDSSKYWQGRFQDQIKFQTTTSDGLKKMGSYYKELEKQSDAFNKKNLNGIDAEIKAREQASKRFKNLLQAQMQERVRQEKEIEKLKKSEISFETRSNNLERQIRRYININKRLAGTKQGTDLNNILKGFEAGGVNERNINNVSASFARIRKEANKAGLEGQNMWDKLTGKYAEYSRFLLVSRSLALLRKSVAQMVQVVKEIDLQMTELKKVTDETDATYKRFLDGAGDRAKKLGATISDVVRSTADFAKMDIVSKMLQSLEMLRFCTKILEMALTIFPKPVEVLLVR